MYNFKIAQLHIQGCEEGLFFLNHSSCNSPMVGKIFLGRGRGGKIRAGEGVPSVCNFYGCCWFKDCIFIMIFLINLITALWFHERLGVPDNLYFFFFQETQKLFIHANLIRATLLTNRFKMVLRMNPIILWRSFKNHVF